MSEQFFVKYIDATRIAAISNPEAIHPTVDYASKNELKETPAAVVRTSPPTSQCQLSLRV